MKIRSWIHCLTAFVVLLSVLLHAILQNPGEDWFVGQKLLDVLIESGMCVCSYDRASKCI